MREINNNLDIGKIQKAGLKQEKMEHAEILSDETKEPCVKDFSNLSAEVLGRSQLSKADNLKSDVAFLSAHPDAVERSDKLFELAFSKLQSEGDPDAYEKACAIATSEDAKALLS